MDPVSVLLALPQFARYAAYVPVVIAGAAVIEAFLTAPTTASPNWYQLLWKVITTAANVKPPATILPPQIATHRAQQDAAIDAGLPLPPAPALPPAITLPKPK